MLDVNCGMLWLTNAYNASKNGYCTIENAMITPPKFNTAPEKWWQRKMSLLLGPGPIFRVYKKNVRGGILSHIQAGNEASVRK